MTSTSRLDPDALALLEAERDFLLRSLRDLDLEHAAGDLDDADHLALRDDYTRRAAEVLRAIDAQRAALTPRPRTSWRRVGVWVVALVVLGAIAGVLVARGSGSRLPGGVISGADVSTPREKLAIAQGLLGDPQRWDDALSLYDDVLAEQPANSQALTYKGWLTYRMGDAEVGADLLESAVAADPAYADARVFLAIVLRDAGDFDGAAAQLAVFDTLDPPPMMRELVEAQGLAAELIGRDLLAQLSGTTATPTLAELGVDAGAAVRAANWLVSAVELPADRVQVAVRVYDIVLGEDPDNVDALTSKGWLLGLTGDLLAEGLALLDRAIELEPTLVEPRILRAELLASVDPDAALAELDEIDALPDLSAADRDQVAALRAAIEAAG